jgi:hypothetical protein
VYLKNDFVTSIVIYSVLLAGTLRIVCNNVGRECGIGGMYDIFEMRSSAIGESNLIRKIRSRQLTSSQSVAFDTETM